MDAKQVLKVFKCLESASKKKPLEFDFFHLWDAESQGDMCVRIARRITPSKSRPADIINFFKLIAED